MKSKKKVLKGFLRIGKNLYFLPIRNRLGRTETKKLDDLCPADLTGQKSDLEDRNQLLSSLEQLAFMLPTGKQNVLKPLPLFLPGH